MVERKNYHILEITRSLLSQNKLPKIFRGEVVLIVVHLINRLNTKVLNNKGLLESLSQFTPMIFGCVFYTTKIKEKENWVHMH